ncbi:MAG: hypothetical protein Q7O66_01585 [Dehalococcoidia bacterium]|nr:hypothetical protein [Dehalococcoidia bacterium]
MHNHTEGIRAASKWRRLMVFGGLLALASLLFLTLGCDGKSSTSTPTIDPGAPFQHWEGNPNAKVVVDEWTDLQ